MTQILGEIQSESNPGKKYTICKGKDGVTYCSCWAWKKNKTCKHVIKYLNNYVSVTTTENIPTEKTETIELKGWEDDLRETFQRYF